MQAKQSIKQPGSKIGFSVVLPLPLAGGASTRCAVQVDRFFPHPARSARRPPPQAGEVTRNLAIPIQIFNSQSHQTHHCIPATPCARVVHNPFRPRRAWGMPGARCTRSLVCKGRKHTRWSPRSHRDRPAFPHAMVLTAYFALSQVTGLSCHLRLADTSARLDASVGASGPHDFAVRVQRHSSLTCRVHRIPCPTFVTIAKRPSVLGRDG